MTTPFHSPSQRLGTGHLNVNVFDRHSGDINQNTDRQRQATERHDIDRVACNPKPKHRSEQRERNIEDHYDDASPITEKHQDHDPGQNRSDQTFHGDVANRTDNCRRLVKLEAEVDIVGKNAFEKRHRFMYVTDHLQRGSRALFNDWQIDGLVAVH